MKDEIAEMISEKKTFADVCSAVDDWIDYYNKDRYQWELDKLSPAEYKAYLDTEFYPLTKGVSKNPASRGSAPDPEV